MKSPILYIKSGCPWCRAARAFFGEHGLAVELRDVLASPQYMEQMQEISGQSLTPTFVDGDFVVADFSVDEFIAEVRHHPELLRKYGIADEDDR